MKHKISKHTTVLSKYLAQAGIASRRGTVEIISDGKVKVNGVAVTNPAHRISESDVVTYKNKKIIPEQKIYILLNKPRNYITTTSDEQDRKTVLDLIPRSVRQRIFPIGRLDRDTTGLLLLTNDEAIAQQLAHPKYEIKKTYAVMLDKLFTVSDFELLKNGIHLKDGFIKPDALIYASHRPKNCLQISLHSGKNRIIRRIFEHLGYEVMKLDRMEYAGFTKKGLPIGHWRYLTEKEIKKLKQ